MAKTPKAPDLVVTKSLPRFIIEGVLKAIIITWLHMQAVGFIFYMIWHNSSAAFREFMFGDFIEFWEKWRFGIQNEFTPTWLQWIWSIPTWKDPLPWVLIAVLLLVYILHNRSLPSLKFSVPRTYKTEAGNSYSSSDDKASDDEFGFDPSAFGGSSPKDSAEVKTLKISCKKCLIRFMLPRRGWLKLNKKPKISALQ